MKRAALRAWVSALALCLAPAPLVAVRDAQAAVSLAASFDELVQKASAVAVVTPTEQRAEWESGRIVSYTHVRVDRVLAGGIAGDAWIRSLGGAVGDVAQLVEGQPTFVAGNPSLVFVRPSADWFRDGAGQTAPASLAQPSAYSVIEAAQGQFPLAGAGPAQRLALARDMGAIVTPRSTGPAARLARDVLAGRALDDAAKEIAATWKKSHGG